MALKGPTKSKTYLRIAKPVTKMSQKKVNQVKDFQQKLSKTMVENTKAKTIIVDDLSVHKWLNLK